MTIENLPSVTDSPGSLTLSRMTVEQLRAELARALKVTATHLAHLASVWRELERRGEDLSGLRGGLWSVMPKIASGDLIPELAVKYAGYLTLLGKLTRLSLEDQRRLLDDDRVTVVDFNEGEFVERTVAIAELRTDEVKQVLRDHIVSPEDQRRAALTRDKARGAAGSMLDRAVRRAQKEAKIKLPDVLQTQIPMAAAEKEALAAHSRASGVPMARLVRAALVNAGLLDPPAS